jgi:CheY-like chemotaxis protein
LFTLTSHNKRGQPMTQSGLKKNVMLIDDDAARRKRFYDALKMLGIDVVSALIGDEAIKKIPSEKPAVIVVNLVSAKVDGMAFVRELRTYGMGQLIYVIGIVEDITTKTKNALAAGVDGVIDNQVSDEQLIQMINQGLSAKREVE